LLTRTGIPEICPSPEEKKWLYQKERFPARNQEVEERTMLLANPTLFHARTAGLSSCRTGSVRNVAGINPAPFVSHRPKNLPKADFS